MKKQIRLSAILCAAMVTGCAPKVDQKQLYVFTSFHEPATEGLRFLYSEDGLSWDSVPGVWLKPEIGKQKVMRDPSIVTTPDGTYHLVWTSSWRGDLGFGYSSSKDLINWTEEKLIPVMAHDSTTVNVWAPELFYDDENDQLMVVWASCVPDKYEKGIEAEDNNHRLYYMTTKDFNTFSETKLLFDPGYSSIDAIMTKRAPQDYVMVLKDNTRPNRYLQVSFSDSPYGPWSSPSATFTDTFVEGPAISKVGDDYLVYFDSYGKKIYGAARTNDFITFTDATNEINIPQGHKHGTIFRAPESLIRNMLQQKDAENPIIK